MLTESFIWEFVRGDLESGHFQEVLYSDLSNEKFFGPDLWFDLISCNYNDKDKLYLLKNQLRQFLRGSFSRKCRCLEYKNTAVVDMFDDDELGFDVLDRVVDRGEPFWWLYLSKCRVCGQYWLVGQEERQNDVFILKRLDTAEVGSILDENVWPSDFNRYENLLRIGSRAGRKFFFVHPDESRSLNASIEELAIARPGIGLTEIAELLNLDHDTAIRLSTEIVKNSKVKIAMDK